MGILPLAANAKLIIPGMMKIKTGRSLRKAAAIVPRLASVKLAAPNIR